MTEEKRAFEFGKTFDASTVPVGYLVAVCFDRRMNDLISDTRTERGLQRNDRNMRAWYEGFKQQIRESEAPADPTPGMTEEQKCVFLEVCQLLDTIQSPQDFYTVMRELEHVDVHIVDAARRYKQCYNAAMYT